MPATPQLPPPSPDDSGAPRPDAASHAFGPLPNYLTFLWLVLAWVQAGLVFLWYAPWYRRNVYDIRSWLLWLAFDVFLVVGATHATLFRVRVDAEGLEFLSPAFRWTRWDWEEVTWLERRTGAMGIRYRVRAGRAAFGFSAVALRGAARLAALIVERADLDDLGESALSVQAGTVHIWRHPSAEDV